MRKEMWTAHFSVVGAVSERVRGSGEGGGEGERETGQEIWEGRGTGDG